MTFAEVDPLRVKTDASVFQFKAGGDAAGATERLRGVERWDPIAAGRAVVYQRRDGEMIIADGHQRLSLAKRLADQKPELQAFVFREADGWTPGDVRAMAAKKNLQEGSGTVVDAAAIIRERPDIIDKSVPLGSEAMRQARSLARLSDDAFDKVVGGVVPPNYAALLGDLVPDKARHSGMIDELVTADPSNVREARFVVNELIYTPVHVEEQLTLLGSWRVERSLMKERVGVLDKAMNNLKGDQRLFRTLDREAGRIEAAGNQLDKELNANRAAEAAELAAVIERLAATRGPVGEWLNDAARAVASGALPKSRAAEAFARRVAETLDREGLSGLMRDADSLRGAGIDEPGGADGSAQVAELERTLGREIELAKRPETTIAAEQVLFSLGGDDGGRARSTSDSLQSTTIDVPVSLTHWLGVPHAKFAADWTLLAAKRSERPSSGIDLSTPEAVRSFTEGVLSDAQFGFRHVLGPGDEGRASWNIVARDESNRIAGVSLELVNGVYRIRTALQMTDEQLRAHLAGSVEAYGADGVRWKGQAGASLVHELLPGSKGHAAPPSVKKLIKRLRRAQLGDDQLFSYREQGPIGHTRHALEHWADISRALSDTLPMLPDGVRIRVEDRLIMRGAAGDANRYAVQGYWSPADRLIYVALSEGDPVRTARHEVVHALRQSGLLNDQEFDTLYRFADKHGLRQAYQIDTKYNETYGKAYGHMGDHHVEALLRNNRADIAVCFISIVC